jgi:hypothetical protein
VADETQVRILKEKGVEAWNEWRRMNPTIQPDLSGADLTETQLIKANLCKADLSKADFSGADLSGANLKRAMLIGAWFYNAQLGLAAISGYHPADVPTNLSAANLNGAVLNQANIRSAELAGADLTNSTMVETILADVDLSQAKNLETVRHVGPSTIGIDTIYRSGGNIPESFLRGAGVPEDFITFMKSLVGKPIEFYSCFISYSSKDQEFAERLHADLRSKNVRCWFAPEDLKIGDKLRPSFDEAIRIHDKLMVLLSEHSVSSPWVEKEVETAFEKERREKRTVLFPIRLDDAVMETNEAWAADIRRGRHIGNFRDWKNHDSYKKAFERLLRDLKAEG